MRKRRRIDRFMTAQEVADELGISRQTVDVIEQQALNKLRRNYPELIEWLEESELLEEARDVTTYV